MVEVLGVVLVVGRADERRPQPRQREDRAPAAGRDDRPGRERERLVGERDVRPREGRMRGTSASSCSSSGRSRSAHTPVALTTLSARSSKRSPLSASRTQTPRVRPPLVEQVGDLQAVGAHRAEALGLGQDGQHEAAVVGLAVVEEVARGRRAAGQRRQPLDDLVAADDAMALGLPVAVLAAAPAGHRVVEVQAHADHAVGPRAVEGGHDEGQRPDEVRRELDHELALEQRLAHEARDRSSAGSAGRRGRACWSGSRCPRRSRPSRRARPSSRAWPRRARRRRR